MQQLPTESEQHWLIVALAETIASRGYEPFAVNPLVEPSWGFFPDPWEFSSRGLDRLTRRLLQYAGLGQLDVQVLPYYEDQTHGGSVGCFLGIREGTLLFGFNAHAPDDGERAAGIMAHEVAHAYRAFYQLTDDNRSMEELRTDLTACFLGFGILCANNSQRVRTVGGFGFQELSIGHVGYLPVQAFAFLLGLQLVVRKADKRTVRHVLSLLDTNQAVFTRTACRYWEERSEDIPLLFEIPPERDRPALRSPGDVLSPLRPYERSAEEAVPGPAPRENEELPVFRISRRRTLDRFFVSLVVGVIAAVLQFPLSQSWKAVFIILLASAVFGVIWGRVSRVDYCSGPRCVGELRPGDVVCPRCGGIVSGVIQHPYDHFEAAAAVRREWESSEKP